MKRLLKIPSVLLNWGRHWNDVRVRRSSGDWLIGTPLTPDQINGVTNGRR